MADIGNLSNLQHFSFIVLQSVTDTWDTKAISQLETFGTNLSVYLSNGFDASTVNSIVEKTGCTGIVLRGSSEIRPGYKDYDELADMLETLEVDEYSN